MLHHHVPKLMHVLLADTQIDEVISAVRCCNNLLLATPSACPALLAAGVAIGLVDALPELLNRPDGTATIECDLSALRILSQADARAVYEAVGTVATLRMVAESPTHFLSEESYVDIAIVLSAIAALSDRSREEIGASGLIGTAAVYARVTVLHFQPPLPSPPLLQSGSSSGSAAPPALRGNGQWWPQPASPVTSPACPRSRRQAASTCFSCCCTRRPYSRPSWQPPPCAISLQSWTLQLKVPARKRLCIRCSFN